MAQQEPIRVVVEKKGGCFSGCGTALAVLFLIGLAVKFWYISVGLILLAIVVGIARSSEQKKAARRKPGPRDPWLNQVAVSVADLGLNEFARNTGDQLGGAPLEGDIGLQDNRFAVYVNLFASQELAHEAEIGLRAQPNIRRAMDNGHALLKIRGPVLLVANGRGGVVDEYRINEVAQALQEIPLPPALSRRPPAPPDVPAPPSAGLLRSVADLDPLEQIRKLAALRDAGLLSDPEFQVKKAELLRRV